MLSIQNLFPLFLRTPTFYSTNRSSSSILDEISHCSLSSSDVPLSRIQVSMYPSWHQIAFGPNKGQYVRVYLPQGYRFAPEDHVLINDYLKKFINFEPIPYSSIQTVNVYMYTPRNLSVAYPCLGDNVWYFFTPRDRKRVYRLCANGYWKCYGPKQQIYHNNICIGYKNSLTFYKGKPPYGRETIWVMKEYIADQPPRRLQDDDAVDIEDDYVLCRIQMRTGRRRHSRVNKNKLLLSSLAKLSIRRRTYKFAAHKLRRIEHQGQYTF